MRETESVLQQFGEFLLKRQLVRPIAAPYFVRWVRQFLSRQASDEPLADQVRHFCDDLERSGKVADWQQRQAEQALQIYFVHFLDRPVEMASASYAWIASLPLPTVVDGGRSLRGQTPARDANGCGVRVPVLL
jgi:hypothetical protein